MAVVVAEFMVSLSLALAIALRQFLKLAVYEFFFVLMMMVLQTDVAGFRWSSKHDTGKL